MATTGSLADLLSKAALHFSHARPMMPMYIHLILSALFPIYTGAHASLSRPASAAKPDKKTKESTDSEDEDENEEKIQKMEGLSNSDAIVLPITAGLVLAGLYFLIMKYGADIINLVMGWYFSFVGVYSVAKLANDALNIGVGLVFPTYYANGGSLWKVVGSKRKAIRQDDESQSRDSPVPRRFFALPLPQALKSVLWTLRGTLKQKYTVTAFIQTMVDVRAKLTIINMISALSGIGTIIYVNTVSKPWFLTNLQGFAVSYSALQLMSPTTFATGNLILGALFCYDIWAVFFTPLMVTVAKNLDQPIKLVFPRPDEPSATPGEPPVRSFSMLGLGDVVLPGIMIGLALRFDLHLYYLRKQSKVQKTSVDSSGETKYEDFIEKAPYVSATGHWADRFWTFWLPKKSLPPQLRSSFPKPYFTASMIGYLFGMLTTLGVMSVFQHAQPALLYLVPGVLVSLWCTALVRREVKLMWEFTEALTGEQLEEAGGVKEMEDGAKEEKTPKGLFERLWQEIWSASGKKEDTKPPEGQGDKSSASAKPDKSQKAESHRNATKAENSDLLFSFSIARYNSKTTASEKPYKAIPKLEAADELTHSLSSSETSDDAVMVSPDDLDGAKDSESTPRHRTRSMRSRETLKR